MSLTQIFTNRAGNTLIKKLEGVFTHVPQIACFDILVGYFRASGYFRVRPLLNKVPKVRILVGIDVDQLTKAYHDRGQQYIKDPQQTKDEFVAKLAHDIQGAAYDQETEEGLIQFIDDLLLGKIELRAHPDKTIHAKVYIVRPEPFNEYTPCEFVTGSSNLTAAGLGIKQDSNYEFNISVREYDLVKTATEEFELLWEESIPILKAQAEALRKKTYLRDDFTPFELYIKMLLEFFGRRVDFDPYHIELLVPSHYRRLKYQTDAANQGYAIMMVHHGFILADVVGLGKTIIALMVIKKFIYENGTQTKVLVVCPPALVPNWQRTARDFQVENHFRYITNGSLHKVLDEENYDYPNADQFDLVVVDESHKFRNDYTGMYLELQEICKRPRVRRGDNGDDRKKVVLVSATPLNNSPADIENQLYLFQDRRNSTLRGVRNLQEYFKPIKERYKKLSAEKRLNLPKLKALFAQLRNDVIEPLVIRRTRKDIENNPEYLTDLKAQGIKFPKQREPIAVEYVLDAKLARLFADTVELITGLDEHGEDAPGLQYYRYRAIEHLDDEEAARKLYGNVTNISDRLASIMRTLLVKRLESSFCAFRGSLTRLHKAIGNMLDMFDNDRIFIAPDLDVNELLEKGYSYDEIEEKINEKAGNNRAFKAKEFKKDFVELLRAEQKQVAALLKRWQQVHRDPKLDEFIGRVNKEFLNLTTNPSGKLVIFTESTETAADLVACLQEHDYDRVLSVNAANRKDLQQVIRNNFDANLAEDKWAHDYDIIITTEVLAEGVNLHRASVLVNYDVPWNATRLMQRIGRVNRIGTRAEEVLVYNFYPSAEGDVQITLVNKALRKLQAFHTAFGEDNKIFSVLEEVGDGKLFGSKVQQEESETEKYLTFLRKFKRENPKQFLEIARLPHKARCGRDAAQVPKKRRPIYDVESQATHPLEGTSLAYFKAENHPGTFCLVPASQQPVELTFLEAARIFEAMQTEKAAPLPDAHHQQTQHGLAFFLSDQVQEKISKSVDRRQLNNTENTALKNLSFLLKHAPTEQKRKALLRFRKALESGMFAAKGLPKEINAFCTKHAKLMANQPQFQEKLFEEVLDRYALSATDDDRPSEPMHAPRPIINPRIVLTISFAAHPVIAD
ncbi:phospholipase D-like domain-containing protein [Hymenobacter sp. 15J16-1T3B]|uniref:helicase-related protein n=1 Tax=Hymenobacter sp. 15J16-1T3B TaxID=2886941 RepID=UPI001D0FE918|nr:helicase-related protein [Hymenobacter sp. 15J16-1T3B]MCC3158658.1 phospholipase D-like domain-containing protein [Hymenobacter sp. 15J16-1T3B]